ncbi:MAG: alpha/beta fold hydrolase [Acidimicrobiales bacterium]|nr:alpha/beta fold hydrolase [Acidimicrobiales bacterium]
MGTTARPHAAGHIERATAELHGRTISYAIVRHADPDAPVVLLVHGMAGSSDMWVDSMRFLGARCTVVAPDLLGHGESAKFRGDYSLGNQASLLRDLLAMLDLAPATFVGQSLGGGIVMQAAYQFPECCNRLVLVDAGGLGRDVSLLLRLLAVPGSGYVLAAATADPVRAVLGGVRGFARRIGFRLGPEESQIAAAYESLADAKARKAFLSTLRSVVDYAGQRITATDRLYLAGAMPLMVVWGDRDRIIPMHHATELLDVVPHARLEVFEGAGHYPQNQDPHGFAEVLIDFIATTEPAELTAD